MGLSRDRVFSKRSDMPSQLLLSVYGGGVSTKDVTNVSGGGTVGGVDRHGTGMASTGPGVVPVRVRRRNSGSSTLGII